MCLDCVWNLQRQVDIRSDFMTLKFEVGASNLTCSDNQILLLMI